jgi:glyoxylase-like metal-dependent hydrolase (beta-lactamase superfamily II)
MTTRLFLVLASSALLLGLSGATRAQDAIEPSFTLREVGPNVWVALSNPKSKRPTGANTGFVIGDDGVAVIDTTMTFGADGLSTDVARQVIAAIRNLTPLPVKFVINTHHHFDHVAANTVFADAGATVLAHRNVRRWIHSEHLRLLPKDATPEQRAFMEALLPPTVTYEHALELHLGSRTIQVQPFPGHTGSDSVVLIADAQVVFAGDLFWHDTIPTLVDASTRPLIDTLDTLAKSQPSATFVPGHGDIGTAKDVAVFREYLVTLRKLVSDARDLGKSGETLADAVMPALTEQYGRWDAFQYVARRNILETEAELNGTKRIPQP